MGLSLAFGCFLGAATGQGGGGVSTPSFITSGQSNGVRLYQYAQPEFEGALNALIYGNATMAQGATDGSALLRSNVTDAETDPYWLDDSDPDNIVAGPSMDSWVAAAAAVVAGGRSIVAAIHDQGEGDAGKLNDPTKQVKWKDGHLVLFGMMRAIYPEMKVIINPIGPRSDGAGSQTGYNQVRRIQRELAEEIDYISIAPEKFDQEGDGGPHLLPQGYKNYAPRSARAAAAAVGAEVPGGLLGPTLVSATITGTAVVAEIAHDGGTDFTPTTGILGFVMTDAGTPVTMSAGARVDATHVSFTLDAEVAGSPLLYYGYGTMDIDYTKVLVDNDAVSLPLRYGVVVPTIVQNYGPDLFPDHACDIPAQWPGSSAAYVQVTGGVIHMSRNTNFFAAGAAIPFPVSGDYRLRFTVKNYLGGQFQLKEAASTASGDLTSSATLTVGGVSGPLFNANGTYDVILNGVTAGKFLTFKPGGAGALWQWDLDDIQSNTVL